VNLWVYELVSCNELQKIALQNYTFVSLNKFNETKIYNEKKFFAACNSFFFFIRQKIIKLV